jgi:hypothetical protein
MSDTPRFNSQSVRKQRFRDTILLARSAAPPIRRTFVRQRISHQIDRVVSLSSDIGGKRRSTMLELSGIFTRFLVRQEYTANDEPRASCGSEAMS